MNLPVLSTVLLRQRYAGQVDVLSAQRRQVAALLPEPQRGRHGALLNRGRQSQDFGPMGTDMLGARIRKTACPSLLS